MARAAPIRSLQTGLNWFASGSGGLDRVFMSLVDSLPACDVAVRGAVVGPADVDQLSGGRVCSFAGPQAGLLERLLGARRTIDRLLRTGEFDLVAGHFAFHLATALDRLRRLPLVVHFHGPWAEESREEGQAAPIVAGKRAIERLVYRRADRVIVLSRAFADLVSRRYGVRPDRVRIVPGSVDLGHFGRSSSRAEARAALGWPADRPILLSVRRLTPRVGLDGLLAALAIVVRSVPEVLLCIAGKGRLEAALRQRTTELGLDRHVRFLGFVPDQRLPLAFRAADINVVPSIALEGFGLTAAEALASGTPSMVTPVGGLPEVVASLSPDLVFASARAEDMASGLIEALRGSRHLPDAQACAAYAQRHFAVGLAASRVAAVYRELV